MCLNDCSCLQFISPLEVVVLRFTCASFLRLCELSARRGREEVNCKQYPKSLDANFQLRSEPISAYFAGNLTPWQPIEGCRSKAVCRRLATHLCRCHRYTIVSILTAAYYCIYSFHYPYNSYKSYRFLPQTPDTIPFKRRFGRLCFSVSHFETQTDPPARHKTHMGRPPKNGCVQRKKLSQPVPHEHVER